ncbi:hypothetical protein Cgig2_008805 [Carnegiea gigantea]|uniref:Reverse transcriptase domain-containing protein n=1 Tax=Carnegiea gigantea TaxID=171969 RepID=A0A9Q1GYB6_9CARY|nr:hypothetical protein Cgig2_008805 [Carnegiea gigantea]
MREFMDYYELHEMRSIGPYYSWTNKTIMSKIDCALINEWYGQFNYTQVRYEANSLSDHTPLLLKNYLDHIRVTLQQLNRSSFHDLKEQQELACCRLTQIQHELQTHPHHKELICREKNAREHYINILSSSIALLQQQCKLEWIKYGDTSSKMFFAKAKQCKLATYIFSIKDETGKWTEGFENVSKVMVAFYKKLLGPQPYTRTPVRGDILNLGPHLTKEQQVQLCNPFTEKDVQQAMFSIPNTKSPGPDGFSSGFFKQAWPQIREVVCSAVLSFFKTGYLPKYIGATKLIVLPKVQHPQEATEFHPISCYNVLYKCIAKMLSQRLKEVLPSIIDPSQAAFVQGRELVYNVLISQDIARGYQCQHISPRCLLKIDPQKAFDSIHWEFIEEMLTRLHFPPSFIN